MSITQQALRAIARPASNMYCVACIRRRLYAPIAVLIWFVLIFCALAVVGSPFSFIGFLLLVAFHLWVMWAQ